MYKIIINNFLKNFHMKKILRNTKTLTVADSITNSTNIIK